jgi:hypothetical protein
MSAGFDNQKLHVWAQKDHHQAFKNIWQLRTEVITIIEQTENHPTTSEQPCQLNALQNICFQGEASFVGTENAIEQHDPYFHIILCTVIMHYDLIQFGKFSQIKVNLSPCLIN